MNKQYIPWLIIAALIVIIGCCTFQRTKTQHTSDLSPNWNYSSALGPNLYQQLANSFVFVTKRNTDNASWTNGDYGNGEYALFVIQRGTGKIVCPAYSAVSIESSDVNLYPLVGKAVLVTSFTQSDESSSEIHIERLELDSAVNEKLNEYRQACPTPFQKLNESLDTNQ